MKNPSPIIHNKFTKIALGTSLAISLLALTACGSSHSPAPHPATFTINDATSLKNNHLLSASQNITLSMQGTGCTLSATTVAVGHPVTATIQNQINSCKLSLTPANSKQTCTSDLITHNDLLTSGVIQSLSQCLEQQDLEDTSSQSNTLNLTTKGSLPPFILKNSVDTTSSSFHTAIKIKSSTCFKVIPPASIQKNTQTLPLTFDTSAGSALQKDRQCNAVFILGSDDSSTQTSPISVTAKFNSSGTLTNIADFKAPDDTWAQQGADGEISALYNNNILDFQFKPKTTNIFVNQGINLQLYEAGESPNAWADLQKNPYYNKTPMLSDLYANFENIGMNTARIPFRLDYLWADRAATEIRPDYFKKLMSTVNSLLQKNAVVILDAHDDLRFNSKENSDANQSKDDLLKQGELTALWSATLKQIGQDNPDLLKNSHLWFEISNEPNNLSTDDTSTSIEDARKAYQEELLAYHAMRKMAPNNKILFEGSYWSKMKISPNDPSAQQDNEAPYLSAFAKMASLDDPNIALAVHQYFGLGKEMGKDATCESLTTFQNGDWFDKFTSWMTKNQIDVILDEVGVPYTTINPMMMSADTTCNDDLTYLLQNMTAFNSKTQDPKGKFLGYVVWYASNMSKAHTYTTAKNIQSLDYNQYLPAPSY